MDSNIGLDRSAPRALSIGAAFSLGWSAMKAQYGPVLVALVAYILLSAAIVLLQYTVEKAVGVRWLLSIPIGIFVTGPLAGGLGYFGVRCVRGQAVKTGDILLGFRRYWVLVGMQALLLLVGILFMAPAFIVGMVGGALGLPLMIVVLLAAMVVVVVVMLRFSVAGLVALDEEGPRPGVIVSLASSWRMTRSPNWGLIFVVSLLLGLMSVACTLALVLPLFFLAMPLSVTVWGATYDLLADWAEAAPAPTA